MEQSNFFSETNSQGGSNSNSSNQHPYSFFPWSSLTDSQKAKFLLDSSRILDTDQFIQEYKSLEEPDNYSDK